MRLRHLALFAALLLVGPAVRADDSDLAADELRLQAAGIPADGPSLLEFFRQRTQDQVAPEKLASLIKGLADKDADARNKAVRELVGLGPLAVPALRAAVSDPDASDASALARRCLKAVQGEDAAGLPIAALRVLSQQRPKGMTEVILAYLPYADNNDVLEETKAALGVSAYDNGKADEVLLKALEDEHPLRRAMAIDVLCSRGTAEPRATLRKLLVDPKPSVRLRAALALAQVKDSKAISTLVVLLGELPYEQAREAEDYLISFAADKSPKAGLGPDEASRNKARDAWAAWWLDSEKADLLEEFKKRTMTEDSRTRTLELIRKLGDDNFKARDDASDELKKMGVLIIPILRKASESDGDLEVRARAKTCLQEIEKTQTGPLSPTAARLVAFRKPEGAVEVLLKYLPFADDDSVVAEVQAALNVVAYRDGKPDPALIAALTDKIAVRRSAAAQALAQPGMEKELTEVRKLLKDAEPTVRMQAALALAGARDAEAVPVLIDLIAELPAEQSLPAEEYLSRLAGDAVPPSDASDEASRKKRKEVWAKWWTDNKDKVRLVALHEMPQRERLLGYNLVIATNWNKIVEIGPDGKQRWEMAGLNNPWDAQVLSNSRVLVLEANLRKLTERNMRGDVLWTVQLNNIYPTACQRLANGNTFVVSSNRLIEVNRAGKEVFAYNRPNGDVMYAKKLKDGQIVLVTSNATAHRLDPTGKEVKTWRVQHPSHNGIDILPNGNVLIPQQYNNRVFEYDQDGKQVWTATATQPMAVKRLPNGNTLISSYQPYQLSEIDRNGKEVWKTSMQVQSMRVNRR